MHDIFVVGDPDTNKDILSKYPHSRFVDHKSDRVALFAHIAQQSVTKHAWVISNDCDYSNFDFEYIPPWHQADQLHVWPTENQTHGGSTVLLNTHEFLKQSDNIDSAQNYKDVCWKDDNISQCVKPEIFVWSRGHTVDIPGVKTLRFIGDRLDMLCKTVRKATTEHIWIISDELDYDSFDFNWRPDWATEKHLHVWPTENQTNGGDTFYVNVAEFKKQSLEINSVNEYNSISWHQDCLKQAHTPDVVIWDNGKNQGNLEYLKSRYPGAKVLRNVGNRFDMMQRTMRHVNNKNAWIINSKCSYDNFDFTWRPDWATEKHLHVWPTENQTKGGDTFYVDVAEFKKQSLEIEKIEYYNAVTWHTKNVLLAAETDIIVWSFGNNNDNLEQLKKTYPNAKTLRYIGTHLDMLKKSVKYTDSEYFWVISDCCDYSNFTTNWKPDWESENSIHCWASGDQAFGDTFYVPRAQFINEADELDKLEYYSSVIWHSNGCPRFPWPVNYVQTSDIYHAVKTHKFSSIYEYFVAPGSSLGSTVDPSLWEKRHLVAYNRNGHVSLCPRDTLNSISEKLADYPYIQYHNCENSTQKPQDIVFISYDEKNADLNYNILKDSFPAAQRVHGVEGMVNAIKHSAKQSKTPWFYAVFAKTQIDENFKFDFLPNYLEVPGNYVFYSYNPVLDHSYGHDGIVLYHTQSVIDIEDWGIDFTMSFPVTSIPVVSCRNNYNYSEYSAWRTSIREAYKLKKTNAIADKYHLQLWLTKNESEHGNWSNLGAKDALDLPPGMDEKINDWHWLKNYFKEKYSNIDDDT